ncbi:dnaJ homolog subfamily C member 7 homolog [Penaeus vannamei]|uniref:dnaJ homolog subfamily C member 7 homolog n=1 Tax=Penaeus vannamei TaxID=6689 RepID=UPI00387F924F
MRIYLQILIFVFPNRGVALTGVATGFFNGGFGSGGFGSGGFGSGGFGSGGFGSGGFGSGGFGSGGYGSGGFGSGYGSSGGYGSSSCRYWCRTPYNQYYCCENSNQGPSNVAVHPGRCPHVRPTCPDVRSLAPRSCSSDGGCGWQEKCCFDTCLGHHVCKPAQRW